MIPCPNCRHAHNTVTDTRDLDGTQIKRRRRCEECGFKFTTYETLSDPLEPERLIASSLVNLDSAKETIERVMQDLKGLD